jgi:hypothetical protein
VSGAVSSGGDDYACAAVGDGRDVVDAAALGRSVGRVELEAFDDCSQDRFHLQHRERGTDAAACSSAERDERVGRRSGVQESLGPERARVVERGGVLDAGDPGRYDGARR